MQITRSGRIRTEPGPRERFTGDVFIDRFVEPTPGSNVAASSVRFTPGARTAWHTHPLGQTLVVIEGTGLCQRRGGPIKVIRPGLGFWLLGRGRGYSGAKAAVKCLV